MTERELRELRLQCRVLVLEHFLQALVGGAASASPPLREALATLIEKWRGTTADLTLPERPAEWSDLMAGEYQDAQARFLDRLLR